ncbi:MAG: nickel-responsive transcriptional regulator NikR [Brockia lithotrophica]|nr:nickel-responsive transcriptional regulator NikR [Brockia lithotrophica]
MSDDLVRFGVSFPGNLLRQFDAFLAEQGYSNRSEAIRDLVRKAILDPKKVDPEAVVAGAIIVAYDHHVSNLPVVLIELEHTFYDVIISTVHVHLTLTQCMEVILVRGKFARLEALHEQIQTLRGVTFSELTVTYLKDQLRLEDRSVVRLNYDLKHEHAGETLEENPSGTFPSGPGVRTERSS